MREKRKLPIIELTMVLLTLMAILTMQCLKWFPCTEEYDTYTVSCARWPGDTAVEDGR